MAKRSSRNVRGQLCQSVERHARSDRAIDFFNLLTGPQQLGVTEAHLPEHRERLYPPTVTLSMFIKQVLDEDGSCQKAVNGWAAQRVAEGLPRSSAHTGGYCRARQRLPIAMVQALTRETGAVVSRIVSRGIFYVTLRFRRADFAHCVTGERY